jgi:cytochrome c biogenesis protein ResB
VGWLTSPKLAIALLVVVLACCVVGVTVYRGTRAGEVIFSTLWFNGLLVLLAVSSGLAFFSRIWKRKLTLVSAGMILFHLSFMAVLGGVVVNDLFHFRGVLRLTEGETLPNGEAGSYDELEVGRFFDPAWLRGETTLVRMHTGYRVDGDDKRAAYEVEVGEGAARTRGIMYVTHGLEHDGVRYLCAKEGYSVLLVLSERAGRELFGAWIPLQSHRQPDGSYLYQAGSTTEATSFLVPPPPEHPLAELKLGYWPGLEERSGQVSVQARAFGKGAEPGPEVKGLVPVGGRLEAGDLVVQPREIRYWVGMDVRYDPGLTTVLASLCTGLAGMVLTLVGRLRQGGARRRAG